MFINNPGHMAKMAAMPIYGKTFGNLLRNHWIDFSETWQCYNAILNHDIRMTMAYFTASSTQVAMHFIGIFTFEKYHDA